MKPNEIHSGGIQDPRSKIAEGSFPVILDPEPRPNEFHSVSFGFMRARPGSKIAVKDLSAILDLGSHPNEFHSVSFGRGPGFKMAGNNLQQSWILLDLQSPKSQCPGSHGNSV